MLEFYLTVILRLILACVLGGIIGFERESTHRPAGFRTHILVCVGSALVMVTSEFIFKRYFGLSNLDPARLGAQVISGIGFLGAGTIIREGFSVIGLTTAASLWAVSCVGIAAGIGFYEGAVAATIIVFLTLIVLKRIQDHFTRKNNYKMLYIHSSNKPGQVSSISGEFEKRDIPIKNIEFINSEDERSLYLRFLIKISENANISALISDLHNVDGIKTVYEE